MPSDRLVNGAGVSREMKAPVNGGGRERSRRRADGHKKFLAHATCTAANLFLDNSDDANAPMM
jgi:hypothetical protein